MIRFCRILKSNLDPLSPQSTPFHAVLLLHIADSILDTSLNVYNIYNTKFINLNHSLNASTFILLLSGIQRMPFPSLIIVMYKAKESALFISCFPLFPTFLLNFLDIVSLRFIILFSSDILYYFNYP